MFYGKTRKNLQEWEGSSDGGNGLDFNNIIDWQKQVLDYENMSQYSNMSRFEYDDV